MNTFVTKHQRVLKSTIAAVIATGVIYLLVTSLVDHRLEALETTTVAQIAEQETLLVAIAEATARNGADAVTEAIVRDCTLQERSDFDDLLSRLDDGLSRSQLIELERLFGRCGSFYAERKAVMVARLAREIEIYGAYVQQLHTITDADVSEAYPVSVWQDLASKEREQSELFSQLVTAQDEIITTLLAGKPATSPEITAILQEVREIQETLIVSNRQAANIRATLVSL